MGRPGFGCRDRPQHLGECDVGPAEAPMTSALSTSCAFREILFATQGQLAIVSTIALIVGCRVMPRKTTIAFDQYGITKFVSAVAVMVDCLGNLVQQRIASEGPQELEVTVAGLMHASKYCIHDPQWRLTYDASVRNSLTSPHVAVGVRCRLKRADDGRPDGDNAPAFRLRALDCRHSVRRDAIGLVEGEALVEERMTCRGYTGGVGQCRKANSTPPPDSLGVPVERKARRGWLECDRVGGNWRPDVP